MIHLVVNAEEFGTSAAANRLILETHRNGIVTSTSVLGNCEHLPAARAALAEAPRLGVGLSLALVGGPPVAPPDRVATLLTAAGQLRARRTDFIFAWMKGAVAAAEVERELEAQVARARDAGLSLDHLSVRGHLGFLPGIGPIVERLARRFDIAGMRTAVEPPGLSWVVDPRRGLETALWAGMAWLSRRHLGARRHGPQTWGDLDPGKLDEVRILEIIGRLAPGAHELLCHPGADDAADERRALTSTKVATAVAGRGIVLSRWGELF